MQLHRLFIFTLPIVLSMFTISVSVAEEFKVQSGPYIGALGLVAKESINGTSVKSDGQTGANATEEKANTSFNGASGGLALGYREVYSNGVVAALEADWSLLNQKDTQNTYVISGNSWDGMLQASNQRETKWLSTAKLIIGYTDGPWLFHLNGGLALASMADSRTQYLGLLSPTRTEAQFTETANATPLGWVVGVSGSRQISKEISLRADYLMTQFNNVNFNFPDARGGVASSYTYVQGRIMHNDIKLQTIRIGLIYSF